MAVMFRDGVRYGESFSLHYLETPASLKIPIQLEMPTFVLQRLHSQNLNLGTGSGVLFLFYLFFSGKA